MNTQQLIELALLDAYGLLDEEERQQFDAAFSAAAPAIQAQVRREQTRLANIDSLLPDVSAPAGLRQAVIEAVRRAIAEGALVHEGGRTPPLLPNRRVSPLWRAAALGLATATLVLSVVTVRLQLDFGDLNRQMQTDSLIQELQAKFGSPFVRDVLFNADTSRVVLASTSAEFKGEAAVFVNPDWNKAQFFFDGLPASGGRTYKLAVLDENDRVVEVLTTFDSSGGLDSRVVDYQPTSAKGSLAILDTDEGGRVGAILLKQVRNTL